MLKARPNGKRSGKNKSSRHHNRPQYRQALDHARVLVDTVCCLAGDDNLIGNRNNDETARLRRAIENHDTPYLFELLMESFSLQGISDQAAYTYMDKHGRLTWGELQRTTSRHPVCSKLRCYWSFHDCGYQKSSQTCAEPEILPVCVLPRHDLRNGRLGQTAYSAFLFIKNVADCDFVSWIDQRLQRAGEGSALGRTARMRIALIAPLRNVFGVSDKVLNMTLASVLLAAPTTKPLWLEAGAAMNAIDSLVHNFLHRTGILRRFQAEHIYGPACYAPNGCADIIMRIAAQIDARKANPSYPKSFPRWVQHAIWRYCTSFGGLDICNGNQIDDRMRCGNKGCPLFDLCDRVALHPMKVIDR